MLLKATTRSRLYLLMPLLPLLPGDQGENFLCILCGYSYYKGPGGVIGIAKQRHHRGFIQLIYERL